MLIEDYEVPGTMLKPLFTLVLNSGQPWTCCNSGQQGRQYCYLPFTDEETEAERLNDLPKFTQLVTKGGTLVNFWRQNPESIMFFLEKKKLMVKLNGSLISSCLPWKIELNSDLNIYGIQFEYVFDNRKI